jgi:hypothetical protein
MHHKQPNFLSQQWGDTYAMYVDSSRHCYLMNFISRASPDYNTEILCLTHHDSFYTFYLKKRVFIAHSKLYQGQFLKIF